MCAGVFSCLIASLCSCNRCTFRCQAVVVVVAWEVQPSQIDLSRKSPGPLTQHNCAPLKALLSGCRSSCASTGVILFHVIM